MMRKLANRLIYGADFLTQAVTEQDVFTPEHFSADQYLTALAATRFLSEEIPPKTEHIERADPGVLRALIQQAGTANLLRATIPRQYGGLAEELKVNALLAEQFASEQSFFVTWAVHVGVGTLPIVHYGSEALKKKYLPGMANGTIIAAYAVTEADAGSDVMSNKTYATLSPDGHYYHINGSKKWITNAGIADIFTVLAKIDNTRLTEFVVEARWDGVSLGEEDQTMGITGSSHRAIFFHDVKVPVENMLWKVGTGPKIVSSTLTIGRLTLAAGCAGACKAALKLAARHAVDRHTFDRALSSFGLIQKKLASMAADTYASESIAFRGIGLIDDHLTSLEQSGMSSYAAIQSGIEEYTIEASIAKVFTSEASGHVIDEGLQLFGGYGYVHGHPIERAYRDIRPARIYEGTNEINRLLIAGTLFKKILSITEQSSGQPLAHLPDMLPLLTSQVAQGRFRAANGPNELHEAIQLLERIKRAMMYAMMKVAFKLLPTLEEEHEFLGYVADALIGIYVIDSTLARALAVVSNAHKEAGIHVLAANLVTWRAFAPVRDAISAMFYTVFREQELREDLERVHRFIGVYHFDVINHQRKLAALVVERGGYPLRSPFS